MEIALKEVEVTKLNLQPGEVLAVTVKSDDVDMVSLNDLRDQISRLFPNNKIFLFGLGLDNDIKFSIMKETAASSCSTENYCSDCSCGKKEQVEANK